MGVFGLKLSNQVMSLGKLRGYLGNSLVRFQVIDSWRNDHLLYAYISCRCREGGLVDDHVTTLLLEDVFINLNVMY